MTPYNVVPSLVPKEDLALLKKMIKGKRAKKLSDVVKARIKCFRSYIKDRKKAINAWKANRPYKLKTYEKLGNYYGLHRNTVRNIIEAFLESGIEGIYKLNRNENSNTNRLVADGEVEAKILEIATSAPHKGYVRWTQERIRDQLELEYSISISRSTVQRVLKRNKLRPHKSDYYCLPPKDDAKFHKSMMTVLDIYHRPLEPGEDLWCMDEKAYQLLEDVRAPLPAKPGSCRKIDSEYKRKGTACIFNFVQPNTGRIENIVTERRTRKEFAESIYKLVFEYSPDSKKIYLVLDNLNTHSEKSIRMHYPEEIANEIMSKVVFIHTPIHGSWLNSAENSINKLCRECLNRRIPTLEMLIEEVEAWSKSYNSKPKAVNWKFTTADAEVKLKFLHAEYSDAS